MKSSEIVWAACFVLLIAFCCFSQTSVKKNDVARVLPPQNSGAVSQAAKSSPAYAELLLQKTELEAQLEDLAGDFTDDFPKVKELRFQIDLLQKASDMISAVSAADAPKLSLALGRLLVRRTELQTNLWTLEKQYKEDYPDVRRLKRKVAVFDRAIREIMPTL